MPTYTRNPPHLAPCRGCGKAFSPDIYNRVYCDACREACRVPGCSLPIRVRGYCAAHASNPKTVPAAVSANGMCAVDGCDRHSFSKGYCQLHYDRIRRAGAAGAAGVTLRSERGQPCSVDGCEKPARGKGLCITHYARERKTGDAGGAALLRAAQGEGTITDTGYRRIVVGGNYVFEHRYVMEKMLGRALLERENVHHLNGDRLDNSPENLEVWISQQPPGQRVSDVVRHAIKTLKQYPDEVSLEGYELIPLESQRATQVLGTPSYQNFDPCQVLARFKGV